MKSVKCHACGFVGWADSENCKKCGAAREPHMTGDSQQSGPTYAQYQESQYQGGQYQGGQYQGGQYQASWQGFDSPKHNGMAVLSLVLGIISLFTLGILGLGAIAGITLAIIALSNVKRNPQEYGGKGLAIGGLVTSIVSLMIIPFALVLAIAIPNLMASRRAANEGSSISSLRTIHSAEATYQATVGRGEFGSLDQLAAAGLINPELAVGTRHGYRFTIDVKISGDNELPGFRADSVPVTYGDTGKRSFHLDESGVIRASDNRGAPATEFDPPLGSRSYSSSSSRSGGYSEDYRQY